MAGGLLWVLLSTAVWADPLTQGLTAWTDGRHSEAIAYWRPLAEDGHGEAALFLGFAYRFGIGVERDDRVAAQWYRLAANQGHPEAQYQLGLMYDLGLGVPRDADEAEYWYGLAVDQGFCPGELPAGGELGDG